MVNWKIKWGRDDFKVKYYRKREWKIKHLCYASLACNLFSLTWVAIHPTWFALGCGIFSCWCTGWVFGYVIAKKSWNMPLPPGTF